MVPGPARSSDSGLARSKPFPHAPIFRMTLVASPPTPSNYLLLTANSLLLTVYFLLLTYYVLLATYYLLLTTYYVAFTT